MIVYRMSGLATIPDAYEDDSISVSASVTDPDEIVVTARVPTGISISGGGFGTSDTGGGTIDSPQYPDVRSIPEEKILEQACFIRLALQQNFNYRTQEYLTFIYRTETGDLTSTQLFTSGSPDTVNGLSFSQLAELGVTPANVVGIVHNHNTAYPSDNGTNFDDDWDLWDKFVARHADRTILRHYIMEMSTAKMYIYGQTDYRIPAAGVVICRPRS